MKVDLAAPIVPGESAAGLRIGSQIDPAPTRIILGCVRVWVIDGIIDQVGVVAPYAGRLQDRIGIGSSIADVQNAFGEIVEDDEDNLIVPSFPGWSFETEPWVEPKTVRANSRALITEIFVFRRA